MKLGILIVIILVVPLFFLLVWLIGGYNRLAVYEIKG